MSHPKPYSLLILVPIAFLPAAGCYLSPTESRAQLRPDSGSQKKAIMSASHPSIKLLPVDEGGKDASFENFRNQLLEAVRNHDTNFLAGVLDPHIANGYDIEEGTREFKQRWRVEDPQSPVWDVLSTILTGGGSFSEHNGQMEFCGPYVVSQWSNVVRQLPPGTDTLDYVAITGKDVAVRREAHSSAPIVTTLSYDVVKSIPNSQVLDQSMRDASSWIKIKTPTGQEGFVSDNYVQGPMDYGACFRRANGTWVISELAARE